MRTILVAVAGVAVCVFVASCGSKSKSSPAGCGSTTSGTLTVDSDGQLDDCSYEQAGAVALFGGSLSNGVSFDAQVPAGPGTYHCVASSNQGIVLSYYDSTGVNWAAISSDGSAPTVSGTCTITVTAADANQWTGSIDAMLVRQSGALASEPFTATVSLHNN